MISFQIQGNLVQGVRGENLLGVLRRYGYKVPSLCYHEGLPPYGSCRVCLVEVKKQGKRKVTTSCNYAVQPGIEVFLDTEKVIEQRNAAFQRLIAKAPGAKKLRALAASYNVTDIPSTISTEDQHNECILCTLCVRTCNALGHNALVVAKQGERRIAFAPDKECVGCAACAAVCPTGCIKVQNTSEKRTISLFGCEQTFDFALCKECGQPIITKKHRDSAIATKILGEDYYNVCESCKQVATAKRFASIVW